MKGSRIECVVWSYSEEVRFAGEAGVGSLEMCVQRGARMSAKKVVAGGANKMLRTTQRYGIEVSALGDYVNDLDPDVQERKANNNYLRRIIDAAKAFGVGTICTFAGRVPDLSIEEDIPIFKGVFSPLGKICQGGCSLVGGVG